MRATDRSRGHRRAQRWRTGSMPLPARVAEAPLPQDVGDGPGVSIGDSATQAQHLGREHRIGRRHSLQRLQPVLARLDELDDIGVDGAPGEPHAHPTADCQAPGQLVGHGVVEDPIEVCQRHVDDHSRHGFHGPIVPAGCDDAQGMPRWTLDPVPLQEWFIGSRGFIVSGVPPRPTTSSRHSSPRQRQPRPSRPRPPRRPSTPRPGRWPPT